jgi:hypothetical protein
LRFKSEELRKMPKVKLAKLVASWTVYDFHYANITLDAAWMMANFFRDYYKRKSLADRKDLIELFYRQSAPHEMGEPDLIVAVS